MITIYYRSPDFLLCQNWPEEPEMGKCSTTPTHCIKLPQTCLCNKQWGDHDRLKSESIAKGIVIHNPEVGIPDLIRIIMRPGEHVPLPDNIGWDVLDKIANLFIKDEETTIQMPERDYEVPRIVQKDAEIDSLRSQLEHYKALHEQGNTIITELNSQLEEKDKAYNKLGVKFDKEMERLHERDESMRAHNQRLLEALKEAELYLRRRVWDYDELPGPVLPEYQKQEIQLRNVYEEVKLALSSQPTPEPTQNYICLNCKLVHAYKPERCNECGHKTFHKTEATPEPEKGACDHYMKIDSDGIVRCKFCRQVN